MTTPVAPAEPGRDRALRLGLAGFLAVTTVLHVISPRTFESMVPSWLPGDPAWWNVGATVAEGGSALLLLRRGTARWGGYAAAATFVGVFVANVEAARLGGYEAFSGWFGTQAAAVARLPLQVPLVWWALRVARRA